MNIINWVHIINDSGGTFFNLETQEQDSEGTSYTLLSRLIFSLQSIAKELEVNVVQSAEMGSNRFFLCTDQASNYLFILKTNRDADAQVITPALQKIIEKYHESFLGYDRYSIPDRNRRLNIFSEDVKQIINSISDG